MSSACGNRPSPTPPTRAEAAFDELLRGASRYPEAAAGLAAAYAELDAEQRARIVDVAAGTADLSSQEVWQALAALLSVEQDAALAERIASVMHEAASRAPAPALSAAAASAFACGQRARGALVITRGLYGPFVELLALSWGDTLRSHYDPITLGARLDAFVERWAGGGEPLEPVPLEHALDLLASVLWSEKRRSGVIPSGVHRFADLLVARE